MLFPHSKVHLDREDHCNSLSCIFFVSRRPSSMVLIELGVILTWWRLARPRNSALVTHTWPSITRSAVWNSDYLQPSRQKKPDSNVSGLCCCYYTHTYIYTQVRRVSNARYVLVVIKLICKISSSHFIIRHAFECTLG